MLMLKITEVINNNNAKTSYGNFNDNKRLGEKNSKIALYHIKKKLSKQK